MKHFLIYILKLVISFLVCFSLTSLIKLFTTKQISNLSKKNYTFYFNPKFNQAKIDFKLTQNKKQISVIGSSRAAGFEIGMFKSKSFYNYSMITSSLEDISRLLKKLDLKKNDTVIIGLDQWNFNKSNLNRRQNNFKLNSLNLPYLIFENFKFFNEYYLIGNEAIKNHSGFRNDGSFFNGKIFLLSDKELLFKKWPLPPSRNLKNFNFKFQYERIIGNLVDFDQLYFLDNILNICKKKSIKVYAYAPPFAPSVIEKLNSEKIDYSFIEKSQVEIKKIFKKYNFIYEDFTFYKKFNDSFYLDGSHSNRNVYYQILKDINFPVNKNFDNRFQMSKKEFEYLKTYYNPQANVN